MIRLSLPIGLPSRSNSSGKLKKQISLPGRQRRAVAAALGYVCPQCDAPAETLRLRGGSTIAITSCRCTRLRVVVERPPLLCGPEHPVDVLLVRVPAPGGKPLDEPYNLGEALKSPQDGVADVLWSWAKQPGKSRDNVPWMRWHCRQRKRRQGDPEGSELLELVIAPREVCSCCGDEPAIVRRWRAG